MVRPRVSCQVMREVLFFMGSSNYVCALVDEGNFLSASVLDCGDPGTLANGLREMNGTTFQSTVTYSCNAGYVIKGDSLRRCLSNGFWSGSLPLCQPVDCGIPGMPHNGYGVYNLTILDAMVTYGCNRGYSLVGNTKRTCINSGSWSGSIPECRGVCVCVCVCVCAGVWRTYKYIPQLARSAATLLCQRHITLTPQVFLQISHLYYFQSPPPPPHTHNLHMSLYTSTSVTQVRFHVPLCTTPFSGGLRQCWLSCQRQGQFCQHNPQVYCRLLLQQWLLTEGRVQEGVSREWHVVWVPPRLPTCGVWRPRAGGEWCAQSCRCDV